MGPPAGFILVEDCPETARFNRLPPPARLELTSG